MCHKDSFNEKEIVFPSYNDHDQSQLDLIKRLLRFYFVFFSVFRIASLWLAYSSPNLCLPHIVEIDPPFTDTLVVHITDSIFWFS